MIVLLLVSMVPMAAMRVNGQRALRELGNELASRSGAELIEKTESALQRLVEDHARILERERDLVETALTTIASEIRERLLACAVAMESSDVDFDPFQKALKAADDGSDAIAAGECVMETPSGKTVALNVDYSRQKFLVDSDAEQGDIQTESRERLTGAIPLYRFFFLRHPELLSWIWTRLENGLEAVYPHYETAHRQHMRHRHRNPEPASDWYESTKKSEGIVWSKPSRDPVTGNIVFQVSMALRDPEGKFMGAVAVAVPAAAFLHENEHIRMLSDNVTSLIVRADASAEHPVRIVAAEDEVNRRRMRWFSAEERQWLKTTDKQGFSAIAADLSERRSGVRELLYEGVLNLAAYQVFDKHGDALLLLIPEKDILADAAAMESYVRERIDHQIAFTGVVLGSIVLLTVIVSVFMSRSFTKHISRMADAVRRVSSGDFSARIASESKDELGELARKFDAMVPALEEHVQMKQALDLAMEVQQNFLPGAPPELKGFDIAAESLYCNETGGDFYDFLEVRRKKSARTAAIVGDVTGHGVSAALLMAASRAYLRARSALPGEMGEVLSDVNGLLARDTLETSQFVTLFCLAIDPGRKSFRWVRAGHDPAISYIPETDEFRQLKGKGPALGVIDGFRFEESEETFFAPGQIVLLGTDGIWETRNPDGEMFGKQNVENIVRQNADKSAGEISKAIFSALSDFRGDQSQEDDVTLILIKFGPGDDAKSAGFDATGNQSRRI